MQRILLYTLLTVKACIALRIQNQSYLLRSPPSPALILVASTNQTDKLLRDWPPTPWTRYYGSNAVTFVQYGRFAPPTLEYEIITGMQDILDQVMNEAFVIEPSNFLHGGKVSLLLTQVGGKTMEKDQIGKLVIEIQVLFLNHMYGLREILFAEVRGGRDKKKIADLQILFNDGDAALE